MFLLKVLPSPYVYVHCNLFCFTTKAVNVANPGG